MEKRIANIMSMRIVQLLTLIVILVGAFGVRLYKIDNPIADWHSWRQSDTAAVTRIYIDEGLDLLRPRYYDISSIQTGFNNPQGLRFVEFPVFNFLHYLLTNLLPFISFESAGRLVSVTAAIVTTFFLYKIGRKLFGVWEGLAAAFLYAFIPFNIYFTRVILPDPLAVAFATAGLWFFLKYYDNSKLLPIFLSAALFSLAMLTKPHAIFYGLPIVVLLFKKHSIKQIFQNIPLLVSVAIVLIPFLLWRLWITRLGNLVGIPHIAWAFNGDKIRFRPAYWRWIYGERLGTMILGVWGVFPFVLGVLSLKLKHLFISSLLLGMFLYLTVIATANVRHDYYQTFIMPAVALTTGYGLLVLWRANGFNKWLRRLIVLFCVGMILLISYDKTKGFYNINHFEIVTAGQIVDNTLPKDARVIAPYNGDTAFLYQTRRFGWPLITTNIDDLIEMGADYYVSVNKDADTNKFKQRFKTITETDGYVILDLHQEL